MKSVFFVVLALALLATLLVGCSREQAARAQAALQSVPPLQQSVPLPMPEPARYLRDYYATAADCVADWWRPTLCLPAKSTDVPAGVTVIGPGYSSAIRSETQLHLRREAAELGFGKGRDETPSDRSVGRVQINP